MPDIIAYADPDPIVLPTECFLFCHLPSSLNDICLTITVLASIWYLTSEFLGRTLFRRGSHRQNSIRPAALEAGARWQALRRRSCGPDLLSIDATKPGNLNLGTPLAIMVFHGKPSKSCAECRRRRTRVRLLLLNSTLLYTVVSNNLNNHLSVIYQSPHVHNAFGPGVHVPAIEKA